MRVPLTEQTELYLYKGVKLSSSNQRYFLSEYDRNIYFSSKAVKHYTGLSYIRPLENKIRIEGNYEELSTINYLCFINNNFIGYPTRNYYCYVTKIEWVSPVVVEIFYKIDMFQTYFFDFSVGECTIEREHVLSDDVGEHTIDEGLDVGEYITRRKTEYNFVPAVLAYVGLDLWQGQIIGNVFTPVEIYGQKSDTFPGAFVDLIHTTLSSNPNSLLSLICGVSDMIKPTDLTAQNFTQNYTLLRLDFNFAYDGVTYTPQNNKLLIYPYCFITVDDYLNGIETYRYEEFPDKDELNFTVKGELLPKPSLTFYPVGYKSNNSDLNETTYKLVYDNFPMIPYQIDAYKQYISNYGAQLAINAAATVGINVAAIAFSGYTGHYSGGVQAAGNLINAGLSLQTELREKQIHGKQMYGAISGGGAEWSLGHIGFRVPEMQIKPEYARIIDQFFTRYGYKVNRVGVPNLTGRKNFNYVKTQSCRVLGNIPIEARNEIENMFNGGLTLWHNDGMIDVSTNPIL